MAGTAARTGLAVALYEWTASFLLFLLGFVFGVEYLNQKISTIPEWFERRFNIESRVFLAVVSLISAVVTKISASLFAGALLCEVVLGINFWLSLPFILILTGVFSMVGGLKAVVYTDVMQASIFMIGGAVGSIYAVNAVGGWEEMKLVFDKVGLEEFPHIIRPLNSDFSWLGMFTGQILGSIWYWCIDQEMSQRILCAKSVRQGKGGAIFAGFLKILPPFIIAFPGVAARVMYEKCTLSSGIEFSSWCSVLIPNYPYIPIWNIRINLNFDGSLNDVGFIRRLQLGFCHIYYRHIPSPHQPQVYSKSNDNGRKGIHDFDGYCLIRMVTCNQITKGGNLHHNSRSPDSYRTASSNCSYHGDIFKEGYGKGRIVWDHCWDFDRSDSVYYQNIYYMSE